MGLDKKMRMLLETSSRIIVSSFGEHASSIRSETEYGMGIKVGAKYIGFRSAPES